MNLNPTVPRRSLASKLLLVPAIMLMSLSGCILPGAAPPPVFPAYQPPTANYPHNLPQQGGGAYGGYGSEQSQPEDNSFYSGFKTNYRNSSFGRSGSC